MKKLLMIALISVVMLSGCSKGSSSSSEWKAFEDAADRDAAEPVLKNGDNIMPDPDFSPETLDRLDKQRREEIEQKK